jgi:hypothetical protein
LPIWMVLLEVFDKLKIEFELALRVGKRPIGSLEIFHDLFLSGEHHLRYRRCLGVAATSVVCASRYLKRLFSIKWV